MGVGGPARWFVEVARRDALAATLAALRDSGAPWVMLGGGSNSLFEDKGFAGVVVRLTGEFRTIRMTEDRNVLEAGAAAPLSAIMNFARRQGLAGLEFGVGIPGTLGGALAGNAGAGGHDICSLVEAVEVLDSTGRGVVRRPGEFRFGYRQSELARDVIVSARLRLRPDSPETIQARIEEHLARRREQPLGERSSGCMFKNPPGEFAGRLIDRAGLKGTRVGGASVSSIHANFMINDGAATARDVAELMDFVRRRVRETSGVDLEPEVRWLRS